jgi:hypothetical protein
METTSVASAGHLRELAQIVQQELQLPPDWDKQPPGKMIGVMRDESDFTTSLGIVVVHSAITTEDGVQHSISLAAPLDGLGDDELRTLSRVVLGLLGIEHAASGWSEDVVEGFKAARLSFQRTLEAERVLQALELDLSEDALGEAWSSASAAQTRANRPWWKVWS